MDETVIVVMIKDSQTGFLEKELFSCVVEKHEELLLNAFAAKENDGLSVVLKLTCAGEVPDSEFDAVYDYYDPAVFECHGVTCEEVEDCYNPTWEFRFEYEEASASDKINLLLNVHAKELEEVYSSIKNDDLEN